MEQAKMLGASDTPRVDYGAVCQNLRTALEPARAHAISLLDSQGDVLWLSEGSMGPDEHNAVREAIEAFADPNAAPVLSFDLGDSRSAVLIRALDSRCTMVGAVMIVMDSRAIARGATKLMTPKLQRALMEFAAKLGAGALFTSSRLTSSRLASSSRPPGARARAANSAASDAAAGEALAGSATSAKRRHARDRSAACRPAQQPHRFVRATPHASCQGQCAETL
jgi:hypothetical protein